MSILCERFYCCVLQEKATEKYKRNAKGNDSFMALVIARKGDKKSLGHWTDIHMLIDDLSIIRRLRL